MSNNSIIKVDNLRKSYGNFEVLKGISFEVKQGEVFALLGVNGAGKTTTLECLEGLRKYDAGKIDIHGKLGVQLQSSSLPDGIKVCEALKFFAKWQKEKMNDDFIRRIGVESFINKQYSQLSTGQKRKLHLVLALIGNPDVIVLDEPTAGLDVEGRVNLHNEIRLLKQKGKTIVLASHDMAEVEELCDRIAVLKDGKIVFMGTASEMTTIDNNEFLLQVRFNANPSFESSIEHSRSDDGYFSFKTTNIENTLTAIIGKITSQGVVIRDIKMVRPSMEERFLEIAKEK